MTTGAEAEKFHPVRDVATALFVTPNTIYKRIHAGEVEIVKAGPRKTLVRDEELQRLRRQAGLAS